CASRDRLRVGTDLRHREVSSSKGKSPPTAVRRKDRFARQARGAACHSPPKSQRSRIDHAALRHWPFIDAGDEAHEFIARRIAGGDGARLTVALFGKAG